MKRTDQVCTPEQAKRLRELGVNQESLFIWILLESENTYLLLHAIDDINLYDNYTFAAFTVAELGMLLPEFVNDHSIIYLKWHPDRFKIALSGIDHEHIEFTALIEADVRAQALIYILENDLMPKTDCAQE